MQTLATAALKTNPTNAKVHFTIGNVLAQQVRSQHTGVAYLAKNIVCAW